MTTSLSRNPLLACADGLVAMGKAALRKIADSTDRTTQTSVKTGIAIAEGIREEVAGDLLSSIIHRNGGAHGFTLIVIAMLTACSSPEPRAQSAIDTPFGDRGSTKVFDCERRSEGPFEFTIHLGAGEAALWLPFEFGIPYIVLGQVGADGPYREGEVTLSVRDETADLTVALAEFPGCVLNPMRSVWEHAKLRGVDYRAAGIDPDWFVEISSGGYLRFRSRLDDTEVTVPTPEAESESDAIRTVYRGSDGSKRIEVHIMVQPCSPPDLTEIMGSYTEVLLDGKLYTGCGRALH